MTTPKDSLKPSPDLVAQWRDTPIALWDGCTLYENIANKAAEWGAQQRGVVVPEQAQVPAGWIHTIKEPDHVGDTTIFSYSDECPWSHWVTQHLVQCTWTRTPLFSGKAETVEITKQHKAVEAEKLLHAAAAKEKGE